MPTATYNGPSQVFRIKQTGTRLHKDQAAEITAEEADILRARDDVAVDITDGKFRQPKKAAGKPSAADSKVDWLAHAKSIGVDGADDMTKAQLVEACRG